MIILYSSRKRFLSIYETIAADKHHELWFRRMEKKYI